MAYAKRMHVVAIPYPAQGHIVPLMQLCKKLAREEDCMVTFVNTEHNHARMLQAQAARSPRRRSEFEDSKNIRLVGIPGGLPPELHGDPAHVVGAFQASEELCGPFEKLLDKLAQEGDEVTCIISDVLMSWTQNCADRVGVPRVAFWTSSAAVYHVIWHMYRLISRGKPTFKAANTVSEDKNTEMVSCIPGLPPMDLNDLPIIVRSDPADFIYQFLSRQLQPMQRAAAVLLNTFSELEPDCLQALASSTFPVPTFAIGPLLPPSAPAAANGRMPDSAANGLPCALLMKDKQEIVQDRPLSSQDNVPCSIDAASSAIATIQPVPKAGNSPGGEAKRATTYGSAGIFSEDLSCLQWLDKKESRSVLYISFGSIFGMSPEQFTELLEGLHASKQAFLWAIRPGFVQGWSNYTNLLPPTFLERTKDKGLLVSWVPQLSVLAHHAIGGFLTHCGWNSTLESVTLGVPMLCWPDVGERRTNGRLVVTMWEAGLEFSCSQTNSLIISRQDVKRVIHLLMDSCSHTAARLRTNASTLQSRARAALAQNGSSSKDWNRFLKHIQEA